MLLRKVLSQFFIVNCFSKSLPLRIILILLIIITITIVIITRRIFAFTRALCLGETLVLLDVVSQGFFGNDGLSCNCFCISMLKMQGYYLCIQAEV